jgi:nicotinamidase-related amidase
MDELLVIVDMQRVVVDDTPWRFDGVRDLLPALTALAEAFAPDVVLTRHVPPADGGPGTWRRFYDVWSDLDREPSVWDLVPALETLDGVRAEKSVYSALGAPALRAELDRRDDTELVLCGVETDCCVLATVLQAVDEGIAVTVVEDAVASPSRAGHEGALALCRRLPEQVRVTTTDELLAARQSRT